MKKLTLVVGSKNASSWSLRPWLFLKHHGVDFDEILIPLDRPDTRKRILEHSPSGRVPALIHGDVTVWESLAICEYAAETFALARAWPLDPAARALARSIAAEMHAGFADLRKELPFNPNRKPTPLALSERATADIARVRQIWRSCRYDHGAGGEWLFGSFGIVDAMFAPVAVRFQAYGVALDGPEADYARGALMHPAVKAWIEAAAAEPAPAPAAQPAAPIVAPTIAPVSPKPALVAPPPARQAPSVGGLAGRIRERLLERATEKTIEQTLDDASDGRREITEPVKIEKDLLKLRIRGRDLPSEIVRGPEPKLDDDLEMPPASSVKKPEPMIEMKTPNVEPPHRSEMILPSVPITPTAKDGEKKEDSDPDAPKPPKIKSFILPP